MRKGILQIIIEGFLCDVSKYNSCKDSYKMTFPFKESMNNELLYSRILMVFPSRNSEEHVFT
jgi:hypothetical protein